MTGCRCHDRSRQLLGHLWREEVVTTQAGSNNAFELTHCCLLARTRLHPCGACRLPGKREIARLARADGDGGLVLGAFLWHLQ